MRVHNITVLQMYDEVGVYTTEFDLSYEYSGVVADCKKGREIMKQNAQTGQQRSAEEDAASQEAQKHAAGLYGEMEGSSTPGSLTPAATAQLAADRDNISRTYNGIRQTAFRTLGQRGFGSAPSGFQTAAENGINVGEEGADTGAFRNAQVATQNQRNVAAAGESGMAGQQGTLAANNLNGSTNAAVDLNKAGSTLGDIVGGAAELAPIVAAPFTGGASLALSGMGNPFSKIGKGGGGGGVGGYSPGTSMA